MPYTLTINTIIDKNNKKAKYEIHVDTDKQAIAHSKQILSDGYRRHIDDNTCEWISPHYIESITVTGPSIGTGYDDVDVSG